jgi:hypothetical protein
MNRAGHTVVPATIPRGTVLYHGTPKENASVPNVPEWLAFDVEHSYIFCRRFCHVASFVTTRELKLLYFDGTSATKAPGNLSSMETQDLLAWGKLMPEREFDEFERIEALCEWANQFGIDGFIRMEFDLFVLLSFLSFYPALLMHEILAKSCIATSLTALN